MAGGWGRAPNPRGAPPAPEVPVHTVPFRAKGRDPGRHAPGWSGRRAPGHQSGRLAPRERVTPRASAAGHRGRLFHPLAHFGRGALDLAGDPALGGDFEGEEPMGLLWSLSPAGLGGGLPRPDAQGRVENPLKVEVTVHRSPQQTEGPLARRWPRTGCGAGPPAPSCPAFGCRRAACGASSCCPQGREHAFPQEGLAGALGHALSKADGFAG